MIHTKRFLDKVSLQESKKSRDVVMPIDEARGLRDEIAKFLSDFYDTTKDDDRKEEIINLEIKGKAFK